MSIFTDARDDTARFIDLHGEDVEITDDQGTTYSGKALYFRADEKYEPDSRARVYSPFSEVTVSVKALGARPREGWECSIDDPSGATVTGTVVSPRYDRTRDVVVFTIEVDQ
jgi:hypothetical protein